MCDPISGFVHLAKREIFTLNGVYGHGEIGRQLPVTWHEEGDTPIRPFEIGLRGKMVEFDSAQRALFDSLVETFYNTRTSRWLYDYLTDLRTFGRWPELFSPPSLRSLLECYVGALGVGREFQAKLPMPSQVGGGVLVLNWPAESSENVAMRRTFGKLWSIPQIRMPEWQER